MNFRANTTADTFNFAMSTSEILSHFNVTTDEVQNLVQSTASHTVNRSTAFCGVGWDEFRHTFMEFHGIASTIVCIFGLITNILNIIVLTRKDMVSSTNSILTGLAVADMLVMVDYLPFTMVTYVIKDLDICIKFSYSVTAFVFFHAHFSVVCHTISIALTLTLAVWRFIAVSFPQNNQEWCNLRRAVMAIVACYIFPPIFCLPIYFSFEIQRHLVCDNDPQHYTYNIAMSSIAKQHNYLLHSVNFWVYSVLIKLLPCVMLTVLSLQLIRALYQANKRKLQLQKRQKDNTDRSCDRTTRMLLAILLLFLITEFPQGILALLSAAKGETFFENCYSNLSEVMDLLALINSAINFILYCVMSRQFRNTFSHLFKPNILNNWIPIPQEPATQATTCV